MPTYYTTTSPMGEKVIIRLDGAVMTSFGESEGNSDYAAYQEWLAEGNTPEPWPPAE